jgi:hypothetical protein
MRKAKVLLKVLAVVMTTTAFASFILEEAVQTLSFGLWILKDSDQLQPYLETCIKFDKAIEKIYWCMLPLNPLTEWVYILYINADMLKLQAYSTSLKG